MTARLAKECLSEKSEGEFILDVGGRQSRHSISRDDLDGLISGLVDRTTALSADVMEDAGLTREDIDGVVLVGGSTRVPLVRTRVAEVFGRQPLAGIDRTKLSPLGRRCRRKH